MKKLRYVAIALLMLFICFSLLQFLFLIFTSRCGERPELVDDYALKLEKGFKINDTADFNIFDTSGLAYLVPNLSTLSHRGVPSFNVDPREDYIRFCVVSDSKINVYVYDSISIADSLELNGRFINNTHFAVNEKCEEKGKKFFIHQKSRTQDILYVDSIGNLVVHEFSWNFGWFLIIGGDGGGNNYTVFRPT